VDLLSLGADVEWPDSEAGTAVREQLAGRPELGHLAPVAEWWRAVRPADAPPARVRGVFVGPQAPAVVADTAAAVDASYRQLDAEGDVARGVAVADEEIDAGADLLILAVPGGDADSAIAVSVLTNTEPVKVLARGAAATDPVAWMDRASAVRDARRRCMPHRDDSDRLLAEIGSARLAVAAGVALRAAARRTPLLIDGPVATAAALIAYESQPRAVRWWAAADLGPDPSHEIALSRLGQRAILGLGTGLGDGLAGLLAVPVIRAAATYGS
jgi:nicotinate-nucleotide--dimethylbenzimidazole phosphoribosyltransferase